jgi:hypothetical protein
MTRAEIKRRKAKEAERERIYQKALAVKLRRKAFVMAQRERERSLPDRLVTQLEEADELRGEYGWDGVSDFYTEPYDLVARRNDTDERRATA